MTFATSVHQDWEQKLVIEHCLCPLQAPCQRTLHKQLGFVSLQVIGIPKIGSCNLLIYLQVVQVHLCFFFFGISTVFRHMTHTPPLCLVRYAACSARFPLHLSFLEFILFEYCSAHFSLYLGFQQLYCLSCLDSFPSLSPLTHLYPESSIGFCASMVFIWPHSEADQRTYSLELLFLASLLYSQLRHSSL